MDSIDGVTNEHTYLYKTQVVIPMTSIVPRASTKRTPRAMVGAVVWREAGEVGTWAAV